MNKELWEIKLFKPSGKWYMNLDFNSIDIYIKRYKGVEE